MRKIQVVFAKMALPIASDDPEAAKEECAAFLSGTDVNPDDLEILCSYDEYEREDREVSELVGELAALERTLEWVEGREVRAEVEIHIRESIDEVQKKLVELV